MKTAIRNTDGSLIADGVWDAIKISARTVTHSLVEMDLKGRHTGRSKTKQFFKSLYHNEWLAACTRLEALQPLVRHCAAHWKAEHVLGNSLSAISSSSSRHGNSSSATELTIRARKRPSGNMTGHSEPAAKRPRQDEITHKALRNLQSGQNVPMTDKTSGPSVATKPPSKYPPAQQAIQHSALGTASFSRTSQPVETGPDALALLQEPTLGDSQPQLVDPSYSNLIGK